MINWFLVAISLGYVGAALQNALTKPNLLLCGIYICYALSNALFIIMEYKGK